MSGTDTPGSGRVSEAGELPEVFLEAFKDGIRDYFNGVIPLEFSDEDVISIASQAYDMALQKKQPTLKGFQGLGTLLMMIAELKKAGFDSLETEKDVFRAFDSFKFRRYLRKLRKEGRAEIKILDQEIAALDAQYKAADLKERRALARMKELDDEYAEYEKQEARWKQELAENAQKKAGWKHKIAENEERMERNNLRIAENDKGMEKDLETIKYMKSKLPPHLAKVMEDLWKQHGYDI